MLPSDDEVGNWTNVAEIEEALRRLPSPATPPGLEARLIAAIPQQLAAKPALLPPDNTKTSSRRWLPWAGAAAAILVLAMIVVRQIDVDAADRARSRGIDERRDARRLSFGVTKETDPCNILPPIPDWL